MGAPLTVSGHAAPTTADLDGDDLDAIIGAADGTLAFWNNTGTPTDPVGGDESPVDGIDLGFFSHPALWDTDGDGDYDLVVGAADGQLHYFENVGTPAVPEFERRPTLPSGLDGHFDGESIRLRCTVAVAAEDEPPNGYWASAAEAALATDFTGALTALTLPSRGLGASPAGRRGSAVVTFELFSERRRHRHAARRRRPARLPLHAADGGALAFTDGRSIVTDAGLYRVLAGGGLERMSCPQPSPPAPPSPPTPSPPPPRTSTLVRSPTTRPSYQSLGSRRFVSGDPADSARAVLLPLLRAARVLALHRPRLLRAVGAGPHDALNPNVPPFYLPAEQRAARRRGAGRAPSAATKRTVS